MGVAESFREQVSRAIGNCSRLRMAQLRKYSARAPNGRRRDRDGLSPAETAANALVTANGTS